MTGRIAFAAALAAFAILVVAPAASLLANVVWADGGLTTANLRTVLTDARQWSLLGNTLVLGLSVALLTLVVGAPLGFLVARTDLPARGFLRAVLTAPVLMPPLIHAIAWTEQVRLRGAAAAIGIFTLAYYPFVMLLTARAVERIDGRVEESARLAGGWRLGFAVVVRTALPAALAGSVCAFLFVVSDFSVPDFLSSIGPKLNVYADEIFTRWQRQGDPGGAVAAAVPPAFLGILGILAVAALLRGRRGVTVGGQFAPPRAVKLGRARWPAWAFAATVLGLAVVFPLTSLVLTMGSPEVFLESLGQAREDILRSLLTSLAAAVLSTVVAFFLAHRFQGWGRILAPSIDAVSAFALALPAIAFAIALIRIWNHDGVRGAVYTSQAVVIFAFAGRYFLFARTAASTGIGSLDPSLDESARLAGIPYAKRALTLSARLAAPSLMTGFFLVYVFGMRELDTIVLIPAGNRSTMFRIYNAIHFNRPQFVAALCLALALLTLVPIILYTMVLGRRLELPSWGRNGANTVRA